jgi:hypothetical protein
MADQDGVMQVERVEECCQIVGVVVHVVALPGLAGPPMAASVMGNGAIALGGHIEHLVVPEASALRGQPWLKTMGWPVPQSL